MLTRFEMCDMIMLNYLVFECFSLDCLQKSMKMHTHPGPSYYDRQVDYEHTEGVLVFPRAFKGLRWNIFTNLLGERVNFPNICNTASARDLRQTAHTSRCREQACSLWSQSELLTVAYSWLWTTVTNSNIITQHREHFRWSFKRSETEPWASVNMAPVHKLTEG